MFSWRSLDKENTLAVEPHTIESKNTCLLTTSSRAHYIWRSVLKKKDIKASIQESSPVTKTNVKNVDFKRLQERANRKEHSNQIMRKGLVASAI